MTMPDTLPGKLPSLADAPWLREAATQRVLGMLEGGGFEGRAVGGVVRNALLGLAITDIDIATTALPADVMRLARAAGLHVVETGIEHGTVTVIADHHPFEVTTLRRDVTTDGRRATVAFTTEWADDARRRDFTMNALYCDAAGRVHDPLDGFSDLAARRVRFVGEAGERIAEDYLRILRFFRFSAQYSQGPLDAAGLIACTRGRGGLAGLSGERIRQEMTRLLVAPRAVEHIVAMQEHGVLAFVLAAAPRPGVLARIAEIEAKQGVAPDAMLRLAALAVETHEDAARIAAAMRLSREERDALQLAAAEDARLSSAPEDSDARRMLYRRGAACYRRVVALAWARCLKAGTRDDAWSAAFTLPDRWQAPRLPVTGGDVMALGVASGPRVGEMLRALEQWWLDHDFQPDRAALLEQLSGTHARIP